MQYRTLKLINKYLKLEEKQREIIKFLYDHTEFFEEKYMADYNNELFKFFAGKITRFSKEYNTIYELIGKKNSLELKTIELTEDN